MKLVRYILDGEVMLGAVKGDGVVSLKRAASHFKEIRQIAGANRDTTSRLSLAVSQVATWVGMAPMILAPLMPQVSC
jgi:hypothetical protein